MPCIGSATIPANVSTSCQRSSECSSSAGPNIAAAVARTWLQPADRGRTSLRLSRWHRAQAHVGGRGAQRIVAGGDRFNGEGYREILGICEGAKEDKAGWSGFLKHLKNAACTASERQAPSGRRASSLLKNPRHGESIVIQFSVTNRRRLACAAHL